MKAAHSCKGCAALVLCYQRSYECVMKKFLRSYLREEPSPVYSIHNPFS